MQQAELVRVCFMNVVQKAVLLPPLTVNLPFKCENTYFSILGEACEARPCVPNALIPGSLALPFLLHFGSVSPGEHRDYEKVFGLGEVKC